MKDAVLAEYVRDGVVESVHRGYLLALNADGSVNLALGNSEYLIFPRSCVKSIKGAAMVRAGLTLEPRLLALGSSSHSGSEEHLMAVREILALAKLDESALQCMLDKPLGDQERRVWGDKPATRISMNCSGKHAAMLLTCVTNSWPIANYLDPAHPLQVAIKTELEALSGEKITLTSTDGCGAPLFLMSVAGLARAIRAITLSKDPVHQSVLDAAENEANLPRAIRDLQPMVAGIVPITVEERKQRIAKAQELMAREKMDAIFLEGTVSCFYYTGMRWGQSERTFGVVIPAKGTLTYVCPKFEEDRA